MALPLRDHGQPRRRLPPRGEDHRDGRQLRAARRLAGRPGHPPPRNRPRHRGTDPPPRPRLESEGLRDRLLGRALHHADAQRRPMDRPLHELRPHVGPAPPDGETPPRRQVRPLRHPPRLEAQHRRASPARWFHPSPVPAAPICSMAVRESRWLATSFGGSCVRSSPSSRQGGTWTCWPRRATTGPSPPRLSYSRNWRNSPLRNALSMPGSDWSRMRRESWLAKYLASESRRPVSGRQPACRFDRPPADSCCAKAMAIW